MALPQKILTNQDLESFLDTSDEWIVERTGIKQRHISSTDPEKHELASDLALKASAEALQAAGIEANDLDFILFATTTPDWALPNTACILQRKLGIQNQCAALDIAAACSGFTYGMHLAASLISSQAAKNILLVGAEVLSSTVDWTDRSSCVLFGDGAGAAVLTRTNDDENSRILSSHLGADSSGIDFFSQPVGRTQYPATAERLANREQFMRMKGPEMFKVASRTLARSAERVIKMAGISIEQIDWLVPHQANIRIIEKTSELLQIPREKTIINIDRYANTSAATIPIAFHEAVAEGKIKRGDTILFDAFGAGLTAGACVFIY